MNVEKHRLLTREEEAELVRRFQAGDQKAGAELIRCNQRFAAQRAHKWAACGGAVEDLFQEACIGMLRALKTFDASRGLRFITYAVGWVDAYISRRLMTDTTVVRRATTAAKRGSFFQDLAAHRASESSLDAEISGDEGNTFHNITADEAPTAEQQLVAHEHRQEIRAALRFLSDRERFVIEQRLLSERPLMLKELAAHFGFSRQYAQVLEKQALRKLRIHLAGLEAA